MRLPHTTDMERTKEDEQLLESLEIEELKKEVDSLILKVKTLSEQLRQQEPQQFKSPPINYRDTYMITHTTTEDNSTIITDIIVIVKVMYIIMINKPVI